MKGLLKKWSVFLFTIILFSCSNSLKDDFESEKDETIKTLLSRREESEMNWDSNLEAERLTSYTSGNGIFTKGLVMTRGNSKIISSISDKVYPYAEGFGKLDVSKLSKVQLKCINDFSNALCNFQEDKGTEFFSQKYKYSYILFINDLRQNWKKNFSSDFPETTDESGIKLFSSFEIGEPFCGENIIQVPVCYYCNAGFISVTLFMQSSEDAKLLKVKIQNWGRVK